MNNQDNTTNNTNSTNAPNELETENIFKLIFKFSIPAVIGMVVNSIYNMVDRMFIGNYVGEDALGGLVVAFPIMMFYFAFASVTGVGGSALVSIKFGQKDEETAQKVFANMLMIITIVCIIGILAGIFFLDNMLYLAGATGSIFEEAKTYFQVILFGIPFQLTSFVLSSLLRAEGKPKIAMISMITAALSNIVFDYIFIVLIGMGTFGAGLATVLGQSLGFIISVKHFISGNSKLKLKKENLKLDLSIITQILSIGSFNFINSIGVSFSSAFLNKSLAFYGGDAAITSMGAINSLGTLAIMPLMGMQQGLQPIIGFNHGAGLKPRVKEAFFKGVGIAMTFSTIVCVLMLTFPEFAISLFIPADSPTMPIAVEGFKYYICTIPFLSIYVVAIALFQATGKGKTALILGSTRQFIFLIPLTYIVPKIVNSLTGVWLIIPISDGLAISLACILITRKLMNYK